MARTRLVGLAFLALVALGACSKGVEPTPLTNDEGVSLLMQQGYTQESAQCLIDQANHQNVDILKFLVTATLPRNGVDVIEAVRPYCVERFGSTDITGPVPGDTSTSVP